MPTNEPPSEVEAQSNDEAPTGPSSADTPTRPAEHAEGPGWRAQLLRLARPAGVYLTFGVVLSFLAEILLEATRTGWDWAYLAEFVSADVGVVAMAALVLLLVVWMLLAITGRMSVTAMVVLSVISLLGVASHVKWLARREPVYPRDLPFLREPQFLLEMVEPRVLWVALLGLLPLLALSWGLSKLFRMWLGRGPSGPSTPRWRATVIGTRVAVAGVSVLLLSSLLNFNHTGNPWRRAFESAGAYWTKASQAHNYNVNGFVGGFLYNLDTPAMAKPPGYSRALMERVVAKYTAAAELTNESRSPAALEDVNVVSVLSESFSDPMRLAGMRLAEDPIPRTRELMEKLPHGVTLSQKIGAGTSSMEFEVLTGMSNAQFNPTMDTPYQMLVSKQQSFPSAVEMFNQMGHTTLAIHPYRGTLYERNRAYPALGFSDFIEREEMDYRAKLEKNRYGGYISDRAAFRQVLDALEEHDESLFVNLVTMQNHMPYLDKYADPVDVEGLDADHAEVVGQYARGLSYSDKAIVQFIRAVKRSDEKTIVLFYGDHLPGGMADSTFDDNPERAMYEPPFFLYSNFGETKPEKLPTTSAIFFLPRVFEMADAPLPPYYALLRELESHISAMEHGFLIAPDDRLVSPQSLSPEARDVLRDYRLVQYDLSIGKRYAEEMLYPRPASTTAASGATD